LEVSRRGFLGMAAAFLLPLHHRPDHKPGPSPTPTDGVYADVYSDTY
jgi:hypothetical protein